MPLGMVRGFGAGALVAAAASVAAFRFLSGAAGSAVAVLLGLLAVGLASATVWLVALRRAFDYGGKRQLARAIVEGTASRVAIPEGGTCLDVGCGSGALAIAVAKRNPAASVVGVDRWGPEYASFSRELCERNAEAEGVRNVSFGRGDAVRRDFPDETFDAVVSNYVYHNIRAKNRGDLLLETLRTLKKGGKFAIHDIFSRAKYGDMREFVAELKRKGYREVELVDTTGGMFMERAEARRLGLSGSALLIGVK